MKSAYLVKSFRQALCATSLPARDEKLLVVMSSLEAGVRAVQLGFMLKGLYRYTMHTIATRTNYKVSVLG